MNMHGGRLSIRIGEEFPEKLKLKKFIPTKEALSLNDILYQVVLIDSTEPFIPILQNTVFSNANGTFSRIRHIWPQNKS